MTYSITLQEIITIADKWEDLTISHSAYGLEAHKGNFLLNELGFDYEEKCTNLSDLYKMMDMYTMDLPDPTPEQ